MALSQGGVENTEDEGSPKKESIGGMQNDINKLENGKKRNKFFNAVSSRFERPLNIIHSSSEGDGWLDLLRASIPTLACLVIAATFSIVFYVVVKEEAEELLE